MSHRDTCPDDRDARREGERAHDHGYGSFRNPYGGYGEDACPEAERAWRSGWYAAERREEERQEEQAQAARDRARAQEEAYDRAMYEAGEERYEPPPPDEPPPDDAC